VFTNAENDGDILNDTYEENGSHIFGIVCNHKKKQMAASLHANTDIKYIKFNK
jgi:hypothetical protein